LLLTRDFIHDRLYYPKTGYFSKNDVQLGYLETPINFSEIFGYEDYTRILQERYPKNAWLTPSEIFKPWYGMTIANYISVCVDKYSESNPIRKKQKVKIIEVGAGNGSAAESMLDFIKSFHPLKYKYMDFTIVEISPVMTSRCRKNLSVKHSKKISANEIKFENCSISKYNKKDNELVFVVMLEVLDNLPHDRVFFVSFRQNYCLKNIFRTVNMLRKLGWSSMKIQATDRK
jgi:Putative S-adenosyl-L-methionine-dependent methyltransferase